MVSEVLSVIININLNLFLSMCADEVLEITKISRCLYGMFGFNVDAIMCY